MTRSSGWGQKLFTLAHRVPRRPLSGCRPLSLLARITEPDVGRYLLRDEDEVVVDEVRRHWIVYVLPGRRAAGSRVVLMFVGTFVIEPADPGGWLVLVGLGALRCTPVGDGPRAPRVLRGHQHAGLPAARRPLDAPRHHAAEPDPRHHRRQADRRPDPRLRPPHLRVRRPGPGAARDQVRRPRPTSATSRSSASSRWSARGLARSAPSRRDATVVATLPQPRVTRRNRAVPGRG